MSLRRVRQRLARMLAEHEDGERDGHAPTAQAHARLAAQLREDIAAIDEARAEAELLTDHAAGTLCIRCDLLQVERDEARATGAAAAAAEAHDRRVRAEALRWEADRWSDQDDDVPRRLRASADEIERGER